MAFKIDEDLVKQKSIAYAKEQATRAAIENPIKGRTRSKTAVASTAFRAGARWMHRQYESGGQGG